MQVFIVGSPLETAMALDPKRLRKQIISEKVRILNEELDEMMRQ